MPSQQNFTFVNVSAPQETKTEGNKKRIRSAAAASGWAHGSRPKSNQAPSAKSQSPQPPITEASQSLHPALDKADDQIDSRLKPERKDSGNSETQLADSSYSTRKFIWETTLVRKGSLADISSTGDTTSHPQKSNIKRKRTQLDSKTLATHSRAPLSLSSAITTTTSSHSDNIKPPATIVPYNSTTQDPKKALILEDRTCSSPYDLGNGSGDAFNCYPVDHQPWFDQVLHHMLTVFAPRGWPALGISTAEGLNWERFMTQHALSDPALFNVRLLFASGDLIRMKVLRPDTALWLRDQAVRSINEALNDPIRAISDPLILAVGRIALHESMYGDRSAANLIHRPAQHRMIMMRGGMGALEFPELVKRLMRWADRVMSMQSDTPRFLPDTDQSFSIGQSVDVLEKWVPQQGLSLRQKMSTEARHMPPQ